jgi:hypothetical protein
MFPRIGVKMMKPQEKLPIVSNNMNAINFRPETTNPGAENEDKGNMTSREAGNEVRNAVHSFELNLAKQNTLD